MNNYTQQYIDECRLKVESQIGDYNNLATKIANNKEPLIDAIESFEHTFFNNMVLVLELHSIEVG
ncbi:hypothetical protein [Paenisporosarcina sp. OV554]|uniref:hypothetical protein n=1 Tax=Paenisporosarcina sp. OV554 TaxID=2135694 RepID=UPI001304F75C|nr:hypothetical protein [Paenisporosarcina sp. OV554]